MASSKNKDFHLKECVCVCVCVCVCWVGTEENNMV